MSTDGQEQEKEEQRYQQRENKQQELIDWHRAQVIELISKGKNLSQTTETLKVDISTISCDYQYIRENADSILKKYIVEILPLEVTKCLSRLTSISNEAWKMAEQADMEDDRKAKVTSLSLAQKAALDILNLITNNQWLVDEAIKVEKEEEEKKERESRSSLASKLESESLNDKEEEEEEHPLL